jgi:KDO2-lipid IV(A) lauroyltransferase
VSEALATKLPERLPAERASLRAAAANFWLDAMFRTAAVAPALPRIIKPLAVAITLRASRAVRSATAANARRIYGPDVSPAQVRAYARGVLSNFYDFVCDVGRSAGLTREQLVAQIESVQGTDHYAAARALGKGAIIATAHMGSFEAGAAALLDRERALHVVFKRDATRFEQLRGALRRNLGVIEAPVDDGWTLWLRLREALGRDAVVMVQADRVMPGQKGCRVPFLHGHLMLPTGPIKLALASGAPIVPIFALRTADRRIRIHIEPHIIVSEPAQADPHPALLQLAATLQRYVRSYPQQWLLLHPAFCEDAP